MSKPVQVERSWLEGLLKAAKEVERTHEFLEGMSMKELKHMSRISSLMGYIQSAEHILKFSEDE